MSSGVGNGKSGHINYKNLLTGLRAALAALPTQTEKDELQSTLLSLTEFLFGLKASIDALPSAEDLSRGGDAITRLEEALARANEKKALRAVIGLRPRAVSRRPVLSEADRERLSLELERLKTLTPDEMRSSLLDASRSNADLKALAAILGISGVSKLSRDALAHRVSTRLGNEVGYRMLREDSKG